MKLLYRVNTYNKSLPEIAQDPSALSRELSRAGEDGWELIEMKELPNDTGFVLIFKFVQLSD